MQAQASQSIETRHVAGSAADDQLARGKHTANASKLRAARCVAAGRQNKPHLSELTQLRPTPFLVARFPAAALLLASLSPPPPTFLSHGMEGKGEAAPSAPSAPRVSTPLTPRHRGESTYGRLPSAAPLLFSARRQGAAVAGAAKAPPFLTCAPSSIARSDGRPRALHFSPSRQTAFCPTGNPFGSLHRGETENHACTPALQCAKWSIGRVECKQPKKCLNEQSSIKTRSNRPE